MKIFFFNVNRSHILTAIYSDQAHTQAQGRGVELIMRFIKNIAVKTNKKILNRVVNYTYVYIPI